MEKEEKEKKGTVPQVGKKDNVIKYATLSAANYNLNKQQLERDVLFMEKHGLIQSQLLYLRLLYYEAFTLMFRLLVEKQGADVTIDIYREHVNDLQEKGFVKNGWPSGDPFPDQNELTKKGERETSELLGVKKNVLDKMRKEESEKKTFIEKAGEELIKTYPDSVNGYFLKRISEFVFRGKHYSGRHSLKWAYAELINYDQNVHDDVIGKLKVQEKMNWPHARQRLVTFILGESWKDLPSNDNNDIWRETV